MVAQLSVNESVRVQLPTFPPCSYSLVAKQVAFNHSMKVRFLLGTQCAKNCGVEKRSSHQPHKLRKRVRLPPPQQGRPTYKGVRVWTTY